MNTLLTSKNPAQTVKKYLKSDRMYPSIAARETTGRLSTTKPGMFTWLIKFVGRLLRRLNLQFLWQSTDIMSSRLSPPIPRSVNDMNFAQEFIDVLNTDNSADADHAALIGSDGDALLVRYRGQDLPWQIPVRIQESGWSKLQHNLENPWGPSFGLSFLEELYKLDERAWIKPELHLINDSGVWQLVETA